MNPKISLFLSATLTAFVVATLAGVVNQVSRVSASEVPVVQAAATLELPTAVPTDLPTATDVPQEPLSPEQAVALAAEAIGRQDVYSVETTVYETVEAYKVVFSSGDIVYIGADAQVLAITKLQPVVVNVEPTPKPKRVKSNDDSNNSGSQSSESEHSEEHEDEHEDD